MSVCNANNFGSEPKDALIEAARSSTKPCRDDAMIQAGTLQAKALVEQLRVLGKVIAEATQAIAETMEQHDDAECFKDCPVPEQPWFRDC